MNNYRMNVYPAQTTDGIQWNVEFPDVKGVGGAGNTPEEAILDAQENLAAHLEFLIEEGETIPEATENDYSGKFLVRCGSKLHRDAATLANFCGISLNSLACQAISFYCGEKIGQCNAATNMMSQYVSYPYPRSMKYYGN